MPYITVNHKLKCRIGHGRTYALKDSAHAYLKQQGLHNHPNISIMDHDEAKRQKYVGADQKLVARD